MSEIELYSKLQNPLEAVQQLGMVFSNCGMFKNCDRPERGQMLALISMVEGKSPFYIMNNFHIMDDGRLVRKTNSADSEFRKLGGKIEWVKTGMEPDQDPVHRYAEGNFTYDGQTVNVRFSMDDAEKAGFLKARSQWEKMPWRMLRTACMREAFSMLCPEIYFEDESDGRSSEPKKINIQSEPAQQETTKKEPAKEPKKDEPVEPIEAELVEPESKQEPEPAPEPEPTTLDEGLLPDSVVDQVEKIIGDQFGSESPTAVNWLVKVGWLPKGKSLYHLGETNARNIIKYPTQFAAKVRKEMAS